MSDIEAVVAQMTLEEKAALCTGASAWTTTPVKRVNLPELLVSDGPHGIRRVADIHAVTNKSLPATSFPTASSLASTWDMDLLYEMGQALAEEAISLGVDLILGPGTNMKRSPLCGRNFEYFSEDPYQAGAMAASLIKGIQSKGVGTALKHFAANNQEFERFSINTEVDERTLREIYREFERPSLVAMEASRVPQRNQPGTYASEHRWYADGEFSKTNGASEGVVVSDWGAVHDRVASLEAAWTCDTRSQADTGERAIIEAVQDGLLDEAVLDESVRRIVRIALKATGKHPKGGKFGMVATTISPQSGREGWYCSKQRLAAAPEGAAAYCRQ
ncbi:MAG: hypothetical protein H6667_26755 [Ardenticatenaceae bacterium]|nr:hypothetical protein [Ardenticatenaceae bacterium]